MFIKASGETSFPSHLKLASRKPNEGTKLNMSFALLPGPAIQFILGEITAMGDCRITHTVHQNDVDGSNPFRAKSDCALVFKGYLCQLDRGKEECEVFCSLNKKHSPINYCGL